MLLPSGAAQPFPALPLGSLVTPLSSFSDVFSAPRLLGGAWSSVFGPFLFSVYMYPLVAFLVYMLITPNMYPLFRYPRPTS